MKQLIFLPIILIFSVGLSTGQTCGGCDTTFLPTAMFEFNSCDDTEIITCEPSGQQTSIGYICSTSDPGEGTSIMSYEWTYNCQTFTSESIPYFLTGPVLPCHPYDIVNLSAGGELCLTVTNYLGCSDTYCDTLPGPGSIQPPDITVTNTQDTPCREGNIIITYTICSDANSPITIDLHAWLTGQFGSQIPIGLVSLPSSVIVPAGGCATVDLTIDPKVYACPIRHKIILGLSSQTTCITGDTEYSTQLQLTSCIDCNTIAPCIEIDNELWSEVLADNGSPNFFNNKCFKITGTLTVDVPLDIRNSKIIMMPNAEIIVLDDQGIVLSGNQIVSCTNDSWNGIVFKERTKALIQLNYIRNFETLIKFDSDQSHTTTSNDHRHRLLYNCIEQGIKGIYISPHTVKRKVHFRSFHNTFVNVDHVYEFYNAELFNTIANNSDNLVSDVIRNATRGYTFEDTKCNIDGADVEASFYCMNSRGDVTCRRSKLICTNYAQSSFNILVRNSSFFDLNQCELVGGWAMVVNPEAYNCNINIKDNEFILGLSRFGIFLDLEEASNAYTIESNTLHRSTTLNTGIQIEGRESETTSANAEIFNNLIQAECCNYSIYMQNTQNVDIECNELYNQTEGFVSENVTFNENSVHLDRDCRDAFGFTAESSQDIYVTCNIFYQGNAIAFRSSMQPLTLESNTFKGRGDWGIFYVNNPMPIQTYTGNQWDHAMGDEYLNYDIESDVPIVYEVGFSNYPYNPLNVSSDVTVDNDGSEVSGYSCVDPCWEANTSGGGSGFRVAAEENIHENAFLLAPNPTMTNFIISSKDIEKLKDIEIYNDFGQQVGRIHVQQKGDLMIDVSDWAPGMYFVHMKTHTQEYVIKSLIVIK